MPRRPKGQLQQEILEVATDLLLKAGAVDAVSIDDVVHGVGCTPPALYHYYPSKQILMQQVCQRQFQQVAQQIEDTLIRSNSSPGDQLTERCLHYVRWAADNPTQFRLLFLASHDTWVNESGQALPAIWIDGFSDAVDRAQGQGFDVPREPQQFAFQLSAVAYGHAALGALQAANVSRLEDSLRNVVVALTGCGAEGVGAS